MPTTELDDLFATVRTTLVTPIEPEVAAEHLRLMRIASEGVAASAEAQRRTVRGGSWRRRWMAVAGLVGGVVGTGGMAVAGALPAPVQDAVAHAVSHVGISLPTHDGSSKSGVHPASPSVTVTIPAGSSPAAGPASGSIGSSSSGAVTVPPGAAVSVPNPATDHGPDSAPPSASHPTHPANPHDSATTSPANTAPPTAGTAPASTHGNPSDTAPGQAASTPGQSGTAPGQSPDKTNNAGGNGNGNAGGNGNGGAGTSAAAAATTNGGNGNGNAGGNGNGNAGGNGNGNANGHTK